MATEDQTKMNALDAIVAASQYLSTTSTDYVVSVVENPTKTTNTAAEMTTARSVVPGEPRPWLVEWDTGMWYGPASEERQKEFTEAQKRGNDYFLYPYFGYHLKMLVDLRKPEDFRSGISSKHNKLV